MSQKLYSFLFYLFFVQYANLINFDFRLMHNIKHSQDYFGSLILHSIQQISLFENFNSFIILF